jgi:hypothetical protein
MGSTVIPSGNHSPLHLTLVRSPPNAGVRTPQLRYYEYHHSRGSEVVKAVLGERFEGVLGSDFLASYNIYQGLHQRCWVHFLCDRHELKEQYPEDADVRASGQGCQSGL